jgi:hypothetical protein
MPTVAPAPSEMEYAPRWSATMALLPDCGAASCLATGRSRISRINTTAAPETWTLAVAAEGSTEPYLFDLEARIQPAPYLPSTIPASCDDMTGAPVAASRYDTPAPLPFEVSFYGTPMTHYTAPFGVGWMALLPDARTIPGGDRFYDPSLLAAVSAGHARIAAYWSDFGPGGSIRARSFGAAPGRHFTIEWSRLPVLGRFGGLVGEVTFQVKLFESTGVVELHYCSLSGDLGAASRAIGLVGTDLWSLYEHSGEVVVADALRFTPRP